MPVQKIDPKVIFASDAPAIDKPPVFSDKTKGWGVSRANDGRPEIKQMNKMQQDTDLKILWLNENAVLPYDSTIDYPDGAVTLKDGSFKQLSSGLWIEFLDDFADKDAVKRGIANRYDSSLTYNSGERVVLANGDIVKSTIDGNVNDPNVNMTGWVYSSLTPSNNLSDVADEAEARTNLDVYSKAETDSIAATPSATEAVAGKAKIATQVETYVATDDTRFVTPKKLLSGLKYHLNATSSAPVYACRAWVNFNGTGTVAVRGGGNIASVIDDGTGTYTINFITPMPNNNYAIAQMGSIYSGGGSSSGMYLTEKTSSSSALSRTINSFQVLAINASNAYSDVLSGSLLVVC